MLQRITELVLLSLLPRYWIITSVLYCFLFETKS
ncbi:mCG140167 [Mus musculus]|nr:mCG140167 [Mus musculus]